jgi:hypothetical protein
LTSSTGAKKLQLVSKAMPMRFAILFIVALGLFGCSKPKTTLAGGKPVSYWVQAVHAPEARVRKEAVFKLGNVGPSESEALPAVISALKDVDASVRREAILALVKFGAAAKEAAPILTEMSMRDRDAQVRKYAAMALEKIQT